MIRVKFDIKQYKTWSEQLFSELATEKEARNLNEIIYYEKIWAMIGKLIRRGEYG